MDKASQARRGSPPGVPKRPQAIAIRRLRQRLRDGQFEVGDRIPAERQLAAELQVDRGTIRRALAALTADGWLDTGENGARFVARRADAAPVSLLGQSVAVLTPTPQEPFLRHRAPGWSEFVSHGAIHAVRTEGYQVMALEPGRLTEAGQDELIAARPTGVIITDCMWNRVRTWLQRLAEAGIPLVVYGDDQEMAAYDRVSSDHEQGGYELTCWALNRGLTRIAPIWRQPFAGYWCQPRLAGYERAMREAGLKPLPVIGWPSPPGDLPWRERSALAVKSIAAHLPPYLRGKRRVEALMVPSDGELYSTHAALRQLGYEPGEDVLMLGYDNYWPDCTEFSQDPTPPAATVDKLNLRMGAELVTMLLERQRGLLPVEPQLRLVTPKLIPLLGD